MVEVVGGSGMIATIFDTETTGLVKNRTLKLDQLPEIIEFYGCSVNLKNGKIAKELGLLIKPSKPLSDKPAPGDKKTITEMTGITNNMLKKAPPFKDVAKQVFTLLQKSKIVIAHNAAFDKDMVEIEAQRLGIKITWPRVICTVESSISHKGYRLSLSNLYFELFGEKFEGAHRAKVDVQALTKCAVEMFKRGWL